MKASEHQILQVLAIMISEICKTDKRCTVNSDITSIKNKNKLVQKYNLKLKYSTILDDLKTISKEIKSTNNYKLIDLANSIRGYMKNPSDKTWVKLIGIYSELKSDLSKTYIKKFEHTTKVAKSLVKEIKQIVKKVTNRDDIVLSIPELQKLKQKNLELYLKYTQSFNTLLDNVKSEIQKYLLTKRNHIDSITNINKYLMSHDLEPIFHVKKYDAVLMDLNFNLYNKNKSKLACKIPLYRVVVIPNESYDPDKDDQYVFKYKVVGATVIQFCYTEKYKKSKTSSKFEKVNKLLEKLPELRKKWLSDLKSNNIMKQQLGAALEIVYQTAMRIGTKGNQTNGTTTYGLLTLLVKHVKCNSDKVKFDYIGKAGVHHVHVLKDKNVAKVICKLIEGKKPDDPVFSITPEQLNTYLVNTLHSPTTIHKFRTLKGTKIAYDKLIKDNPCSKLKSDTEKMNYLKQTMLEIGKELGHVSGEKITGDTALKNYVDPNIIKQYFENCNLKMPKAIQQLTEEDVYDAVPEYPQWPGYYQAEPAHKILTHYTRNFI